MKVNIIIALVSIGIVVISKSSENVTSNGTTTQTPTTQEIKKCPHFFEIDRLDDIRFETGNCTGEFVPNCYIEIYFKKSATEYTQKISAGCVTTEILEKYNMSSLHPENEFNISCRHHYSKTYYIGTACFAQEEHQIYSSYPWSFLTGKTDELMGEFEATKEMLNYELKHGNSLSKHESRTAMNIFAIVVVSTLIVVVFIALNLLQYLKIGEEFFVPL